MPAPSSPFWKFRNVEANTLKMLINKKLWFSHPSKFNDPFDTRIDLASYLNKIGGRVGLKHSREFGAISNVYLPRHEEILKSRFLYCVNQQSDGFNPFEEVLMWSHYADEHRGICIGMNMDSVKRQLPSSPNFATERTVTYGEEIFINALVKQVDAWPSDALLKLDYRNIASQQIADFTNESYVIARLFDSFSFVKSRNWSYEHEYRFALNNQGIPGVGALVKFDPTDFENIIFGLFTPEGDKEAIMHLVESQEWKHVKVWQAKRADDIFKLDFEQIK